MGGLHRVGQDRSSRGRDALSHFRDEDPEQRGLSSINKGTKRVYENGFSKGDNPSRGALRAYIHINSAYIGMFTVDKIGVGPLQGFQKAPPAPRKEKFILVYLVYINK